MPDNDNGMNLSPVLHRLLTLTLAERLEARGLREHAGRITSTVRADIRKDAARDAERAIREAIETLATIEHPEEFQVACAPSLAELIARVQ